MHFTGATFTVDPSAPGLLTFSSGAEVRYPGMSQQCLLVCHGCAYWYVSQQQALRSTSRRSAALQVMLDQSRVAKLEIGALSAIATVGTTLNVTRSTFTGTHDLQAVHPVLHVIALAWACTQWRVASSYPMNRRQQHWQWRLGAAIEQHKHDHQRLHLQP